MMDAYEEYKKRRGDPTTEELYPPEFYPSNLRECPFCGNICQRQTEDGKINLRSVRVESKYLNEGIRSLSPETVYFVLCRMCYGRSGNGATIRDAVKKWNTRI